ATLQQEEPRLESETNSWYSTTESLREEIAEKEKQLLEALSHCDKDVLENEALVQSLSQTKASVEEAKQSLEQALTLQESLQQQRDRYYSVARCGAGVFALLELLGQINPAYSLSCEAFVSLFSLAISLSDPAEASSSLTDQPELLQRRVLTVSLHYILGSVLRKDRLLVLLLYVRAFCLKDVLPSEWEYLLRCLNPNGKHSPWRAAPTRVTKTTALSWIPVNRKESLARLLEFIPNAEAAWNLQDENSWRKWIELQHCTAEMPEAAQRVMTPVQKLLLIQALKPHLFEAALESLLYENLGIQKGKQRAFYCLKALSSTKAPTAHRPILFVTDPGYDPSHEIEQLSREFRKEGGEPVTVKCIALGGGLEEQATAVVMKAAAEGDWVFVRNLHYAPNWLLAAEQALKGTEKCDSFRCFLSTEAAEHLADNVLYSSVF
ncbi:cytoplasmic dynein heavy chain 1b, partial [Cystoisospora suis]